MTKNITYLLYVRKYSIITNDYVLYVYKVTTDNIYRIIGKIVCTSMEHIKRIDFNEWMQEREDFWKENGYDIHPYREPKLSNDLYPLDYISQLEKENERLSAANALLSKNSDNAYQQGLNEMRELVKPEIAKEILNEVSKHYGGAWLVELYEKYGINDARKSP